jgi:hypothetical protein
MAVGAIGMLYHLLSLATKGLVAVNETHSYGHVRFTLSL